MLDSSYLPPPATLQTFLREISQVKRKRDAEVRDLLQQYIQVFVCLSIVFPSVFRTVEYAMAIIDSLREFDALIVSSMTEEAALCLDQVTILPYSMHVLFLFLINIISP